MPYALPHVTEQSHRGERTYSIFDRLLKDRIVFLGEEVNDITANIVIAQFLFLESDDPEKDISFYINSPGGEVTAGLAIYDTMNYIQASVSTVCIGQAASMAAVLLTAGDKGKRFALPNSRVMLHQPMGSMGGKASDMEIQAREILKMKDTLTSILQQHTGQPLARIKDDCDRDFFLSAVESMEYGVVDKVMDNRTKLEEKSESNT